MKRRDFIAGLGGAAVVGSRGAWGQQVTMPLRAGAADAARLARLLLLFVTIEACCQLAGLWIGLLVGTQSVKSDQTAHA
jgi:hypothetical protein